jgi:outer membrane protein OmpA-like peptidoglycan-associated protein
MAEQLQEDTMGRTRLAVLGLLLAASGLSAQGADIGKGTVEIGGLARGTRYPSVLGTDSFPDQNNRPGDQISYGGRLGYFFAKNLTLEADGAYGETDRRFRPDLSVSEIRYAPFHLRLVYNAPVGNHWNFMLGGGGNYTRLRGAETGDYFGPAAMAGLRWQLSKRLHLRTEGTVDFIPSGFGDESNTYLGVQAGASLMFGKGCDHAMDMIGIRPMTATLAPGATQNFTSEATYCGKPDAVTYTLSGPGTIDATTGRYTAAGEGTATVTAHSAKGKLMSSATVTVRTPPPPPPPPAPAPAPRPAPPPPPAPRYNFELAIVHFRFDHADLTQGGIDSVKAVAATLKAHPEVNVDVTGHTDWVGTNAYNMKLSQARAETVRKLLVAEGVADSRISAKWRGEEEPVMDNKTAAGRAANRRTEIKQNN